MERGYLNTYALIARMVRGCFMILKYPMMRRMRMRKTTFMNTFVRIAEDALIAIEKNVIGFIIAQYVKLVWTSLPVGHVLICIPVAHTASHVTGNITGGTTAIFVITTLALIQETSAIAGFHISIAQIA